MTMTTQEIPQTEPLNASERCDRCNAQAVAVVFLHDVAALEFCNHHWQQNRTGLLNSNAVVHVHPLP